VENRSDEALNQRVLGSNPSVSTIFFNDLALKSTAKSHSKICHVIKVFPTISRSEGAQVRQGERGSVVVLWKQFGANDADAQAPDDEGNSRRLIFARAFPVLNVEQVDGYVPPPAPQLDDGTRFAAADGSPSLSHILASSSTALLCLEEG
jgi:hypothetical protein